MTNGKMYDDEMMKTVKSDLIKLMNEYEFDTDKTEKLTNDENVILYACYCIMTMNDEYQSVYDLMNDYGFLEFLQLQYETPITFDKMIAE